MNKFQVQLVWNREFDWAYWLNPFPNLKTAKSEAVSIRDSGDGARVKKVRVIDIDTEEVLWNG